MKQWTRGLRRWTQQLGLGLGLCLASGTAVTAHAGTLTVEFGALDRSQRAAFTAFVDEFKAANPDVEVKLTLTDLAAYRAALPKALEGGEAPDVFNWFAGDQMRGFAQSGLLDDLSDLWKANAWNNAFASVASAATVGGRQYALPYQYYTWGLFYRHDVLERAGVPHAPRDLSGLINACTKLSRAGFIPVALGAKDGWALAAWFDYLDLRNNGPQLHEQLTDGQLAYQDSNVRRTFLIWRQLVDAKCFAPDALNTDVNAARRSLFMGHAGMILAGTTFSATIPEALKDIVDYARFPVIDPTQPLAEAAPTDTFHIAAHARNKADARRFLRYAATSAANAKLAKALGSFPTSKFAPVQGTVLDLSAYKVLNDAKGGLVQAYDRDTPPEMAAAGMRAMQEFLAQPRQVDALLARLDAVEKTAYRPVVEAAAPAAAKPVRR